MGESTTQSSGTDWPGTLLAIYTGLAVENKGVSGWGSADVLTRMGAFRPRLTLAGGEIPTSGTVTITTIDPASGWRKDSGTGSFSFAGSLAAVRAR